MVLRQQSVCSSRNCAKLVLSVVRENVFEHYIISSNQDSFFKLVEKVWNHPIGHIFQNFQKIEIYLESNLQKNANLILLILRNWTHTYLNGNFISKKGFLKQTFKQDFRSFKTHCHFLVPNSLLLFCTNNESEDFSIRNEKCPHSEKRNKGTSQMIIWKNVQL